MTGFDLVLLVESGCLRSAAGSLFSLRQSRDLALEILRQQVGRLPEHGNEVLRARGLRLVRIPGRPQIIEVPDGSEVLMLSLAAVELRLQSLDSDVDEQPWNEAVVADAAAIKAAMSGKPSHVMADNDPRCDPDICASLEPDTLDGGHYTCTEPRGHAGPHKGRNFVEGGTSQWPNAR